MSLGSPKQQKEQGIEWIMSSEAITKTALGNTWIMISEKKLGRWGSLMPGGDACVFALWSLQVLRRTVKRAPILALGKVVLRNDHGTKGGEPFYAHS